MAVAPAWAQVVMAARRVIDSMRNRYWPEARWILALAVLTTSVRTLASDVSADLEQLDRLTAVPARGAALYSACAACHDQQRSGIAGSWVPLIAGQHARVLAKELIDYRHHERWDPRMETIASRHVLTSLQEIADVASYAAALPAAPGLVGDGSGVQAGQMLYAARCADCHGRAAEGSNARRVPRLAGQRFEYLLRQLHDSLESRRPNMPPVHRVALRKLDQQELNGLADYLSRLPAGAART
jgi:cytochrome c553